MFDISEYELSEALQDDSIPDDEKPQAAIYPTVPLGSYNENKYIIPLGTYLYEQEAGVRQIYSSSDKAAISIYDTKGPHRQPVVRDIRGTFARRRIYEYLHHRRRHGRSRAPKD